MNVLFELFKKKDIAAEDIADALKADKGLVSAFEDAYKRVDFSKINAKQAAEIRREIRRQTTKIGADEELRGVVNRAVDELIAQTAVFSYEPDEKRCVIYDKKRVLPESGILTVEDINKIPVEKRPQLTGYLLKRDMPDSGITALASWEAYKKEKNPKLKANLYGHFRQGLDILDVDSLLYAMINKNPNSMGNWLPYIVEPVNQEGFFKIPATKIIKLPITLLQLTRQEYGTLTPATFEIVNEYCYKAFDLDDTKDYFVKTGTYSSKFDFRNARVKGANEVSELGEYLLYNHWSALQMAHYDLSEAKRPIVFGVSTTVEWVVREFIPDVEDNLTIYHGLPLRTEYRAFVDFDTKEVLGIHSYWDDTIMEKHFKQRMRDNSDIDAKHDYITYLANKDRLYNRYEANKDRVCEHLSSVLLLADFKGQWSVDIMQNGEDFYIIDMALAENSAFYNEEVPLEKRRVAEENWVPALEDNKG